MNINKGDKLAFSCTGGELIFNGKVVTELISLEAKLSIEYNDIQIANSDETYRKYKGRDISGTIAINKINSEFINLASSIIKNKYAPEIAMQSILTDPAHQGAEVVAFYGVTLDELILSKIKTGENFEYEIPFKARDFELLEELE